MVGGAGAAANLRPHGGSRAAVSHAAATPAPSFSPSATLLPPTPSPAATETPWPAPPPTVAPTPAPTAVPSPPAPVLGGRLAPGMAWDGNTGTVLLFGGTDAGDHAHGDTWSWNGGGWKLLRPPSSPSPRSGSAMGWDPAHHQVVLFGGSAPGSMNFDTWTWDGHTWTERHPATTPQIWLLTGSTEGFMAYDPVHAQLVMVGATQFGNDTTWTWDGAGWTVHQGKRQRYRGTPPAWDPVTRRLTLVLPGGPGEPGGIQFTWNGSDWDAAPLADPALVPALVVATDGTRGLVAVDQGGGTWTWDGTVWTRGPAAGRVPTWEAAGIAVDPVHGTVVVTGGHRATPQWTGVLSGTWTWDGSRWRSF